MTVIGHNGPMDSLLPAVEDLLRHVAEQEILTRFGRLGEEDVRRKGEHGDLVTTADLEAENRIREGLLRLLPDSAVIGEEGAYKTPAIMERLAEDAPVWVVDPVDGTRNFAQGKACFAVMCALVEKGQTRLGWILDPVSGNCATVERGKGAYIAEQRLTVRRPDGLKTMRGSVGERIQHRLRERQEQGETNMPGTFVRYHCVGREYMDLALGKLHFGLYGGRLMPWDHAAGTLLVEEAGAFPRTVETKRPYSPVHFGHGERLLIAPDEESFGALSRVLADG